MPRNLINRIALAHAYLRRRPILHAFPFELQIGITNRCNLDCVFCPRRKSSRPVGAMDLSLFERLVAEAASAVDTVDLSFDGEPFLHPRWEECLEVCRRHGVRSMLETNALIMDEALARNALAAGLGSITFSLDAATPETYRRLKPSGDFEKAERNVDAFLRLARGRRDRPYIQIQFVKTDENAAEVTPFLRRWRGRGADAVHVKPMLNFAGSCGPAPSRPARRPCLFLWSSLAVNWDGTVPLCCLEIEGRTLMGDARKNTLREIADSDAFREVRRLHIEGRYRDHPVCRNCDVPSVAWPFVLGAAFVGDLARRKLINAVERLVPLKKI